MLSKLNRDCLRDIYGDALSVIELASSPISDPRAILKALQGYIDGVTRDIVDEAVKRIREKNIDCIFVDGSNLGEIVACLRRQGVRTRIATFFHNVESRFFLGSFRAARTPRAFMVLVANYLAERKSVRHSDSLIAMTMHDSVILKKVYGRSATHISAMALEDRRLCTDSEASTSPAFAADRYLLFVGGAFYANRRGVEWFAHHVAPRINMKTIVVGRGLESLKPKLEGNANIEVVGGVGDLAPWYLGAHCVIAPIFDGSGMKTKVAEAIMFGKKVIASPDAFCGYESVAARVGWTCATADEFVHTVRQVEALALPPFDPQIRVLFDEEYSYSAARFRLARILEEPTQSGFVGSEVDQQSFLDTRA
jgi:glycosyltransferase involved in cell wall biosynthesis